MDFFNRKFLYFVALLGVAGCNDLDDQVEESSPKTEYPPVLITEATPQRVIDLTTIIYALEAYKRDHRSYPLSVGSGRQWSGVNNGVVGNAEDWIGGLVPRYLHVLPRDPRGSDSSYPQYIYKSNGAHYKLISRNPSDCEKVKVLYPYLIDRKRGCRAYGYWTPKAAMW